jgi:hypothetical protein
MSEKLLEKIILPNGLLLELWNNSRLLAGDRWLVLLVAKVEVPVLPEYFSTLDNGEQAYRDLVDSHGDPLVFIQEKAKHFVDGRKTEETITGLCQRFKDNLIGYLGNPKFAPQYVLKKYGDLRDRHNWSTEEASEK